MLLWRACEREGKRVWELFTSTVSGLEFRWSLFLAPFCLRTKKIVREFGTYSASSLQVLCKFSASATQLRCRVYGLASALQSFTEEFVGFVPGASVLQNLRTCIRVAAKSDTRMRRSASSRGWNLQRFGTVYIRSSGLNAWPTYVLSAWRQKKTEFIVLLLRSPPKNNTTPHTTNLSSATPPWPMTPQQ